MGRLWTKSELQYLKKNRDTVSYETIAYNLGRTVCAVKAKIIRLYGNKEYDGLKTMEIAEILGVSKWYIRNYIKKYGLKAKEIKRAGKVYTHIITIEDFWEWSKYNFDLVKWEKADTQLLSPIPKWYLEKLSEYKNKTYNTKRKEKWTKNQLAYLKFYRDQGKSFEEIAALLKKSKISVENKYYKTYNKRKNIHMLWNDYEVKKLLKMKEEGKTYKYISEILGRSKSSVKRKYQRMIQTN